MLKKIGIFALMAIFSLNFGVSVLAKGTVVVKPGNKRKIQINGTMGETTEKLIVKAQGIYLMGENDTPAYARQMCLVNAKKTAAENARSRIKSETVVINGVLEKDEIMINSEGDITVLSSNYLPVSGNEYKVDIEAEVRINTLPQTQEVNQVEVTEGERLKVFIATPKDTYSEGEKISFRLQTTKDAYIRVKYRSVDGEILQLIPNKFRNDNFVKAFSEMEIPENLGKDYNFEVIEPFGEERLFVEASEKPFVVDSEPEKLEGKIRLIGAYESGVEISTANTRIFTKSKEAGSAKRK